MRIISGTSRGRKLLSPGKSKFKNKIRPTSDRAREAIFNIIGHQRITGATVLDLFAGTGALGLEALSRGASSAVFVDFFPTALKLISQNIENCGFVKSAAILKKDLSKGLFCLKDLSEKYQIVVKNNQFDIVFLDPPYKQNISEFLLSEIQEKSLITSNSLVIFEDSSKEKLIPRIKKLALVDQRIYGDTGFWLYQMDTNGSEIY